MATFPQVSGYNLEGRRYNLPGDLEGEINLLFIPFQRWRQDWVDGWMPAAQRLRAAYPGLHVYETPTLPAMNLFARMGIDLGMKMGIPDRAVREATITLYLDKDAYRRALEIASEETIYLMLVTRRGEILWRGEGPYAAATAASLTQALAEILGAPVM
jgi:hypothetical protein